MFGAALAPIISAGTGLPAGAVLTGDGRNQISQRRVYEALGVPFALEEWTGIFRGTTTIPEGLDDVLAPFFDNALIVGFELPMALTNWLSARHITYIDFCTCPLQFMDDLAVAIRSNSQEVNASLATFGLSREQCFAFAGILKASLIHAAIYKAPAPEAQVGSAALFCAGYHKDRNLAANGRFWNYRDFEEEVRSLAAEHGTLWFKPHPWAGSTPDDDAFFGSLPNIQVTRRNVYETLSLASDLRVISLCSSTSLEAEFFGHSGLNLVGPPAELYYRVKGRVPQGVERPIILHDIWDSSFWRTILGLGSPRRASDVRLDRKPNRLRNMMGFFGPASAIDLLPQHAALQTQLNS